MSGLVVSGVAVHAGTRAILDSVGFSAPAGKLTGLIGPNGAGKSTLIGAVLGLIRLTGGAIRFGAADLPNMAPAERARLCAHVEQSATTSERLTVHDVVSLGRLPYQTAWQATPSAHDEAVVTAALKETGMSAFAGRLYNSLSGGEQQRVQIARALAQEPRLLLLDEPTSHLDVKAQLQVLETLGRRARQGCTVVIALHDLNLAARYCDHMVMLKAGHVAAEGPPQAVIDAALLRDVYGVEATILRPESSPYPLVVYDRAITENSPPKSD